MCMSYCYNIFKKIGVLSERTFTFSYIDNRGQKSLRHWRQCTHFEKSANTPIQHCVITTPSPETMLLFFIEQPSHLRHLLHTKNGFQHCSGGRGCGKYGISLKNWKVSQDFCPRLSEYHFPQLRVTYLRMEVCIFPHSVLSNYACSHQTASHFDCFLYFYSWFSPFFLLLVLWRQLKNIANLSTRCDYRLKYVQDRFPILLFIHLLGTTDL